MKGILADANALGQVTALVQQMQSGEWAEFWIALGLEHKHFGDVGLSIDSTDLEIWKTCQPEELVLVTDNRNLDAPDSLEATIREYNLPDSLPVFTISDPNAFRTSRAYANKVLEIFTTICCESTKFAAPDVCTCRKSRNHCGVISFGGVDCSLDCQKLPGGIDDRPKILKKRK